MSAIHQNLVYICQITMTFRVRKGIQQRLYYHILVISSGTPIDYYYLGSMAGVSEGNF